jgi:hypothetical protein
VNNAIQKYASHEFVQKFLANAPARGKYYMKDVVPELAGTGKPNAIVSSHFHYSASYTVIYKPGMAIVNKHRHKPAVWVVVYYIYLNLPKDDIEIVINASNLSQESGYKTRKEITKAIGILKGEGFIADGKHYQTFIVNPFCMFNGSLSNSFGFGNKEKK